MSLFFAIKRRHRLLSKAHDLDHIEAVAHGAEAYLTRKGHGELSDLAYLAGLFHDMLRQPSKTKCYAALGAKWVLNSVEGRDIARGYGREVRQEVAFAIALHSLPFNLVYELIPTADYTKAEDAISLILEKGEKQVSKADLQQCRFSWRAKLVAEAVCYADKILEGKGPRAVERRSFFVGGERLEKDKALAEAVSRFGRMLSPFYCSFTSYTEKLAPCVAIIGESLVRWYIKNPLHKYPEEIQKDVKPLFYWERLYVGSLVRAVLSFEGIKKAFATFAGTSDLNLSAAALVHILQKCAFPNLRSLSESEMTDFLSAVELAEKLNADEINWMRRVALAYASAARENLPLDAVTFDASLFNALPPTTRALMEAIRSTREERG